ncbi:hypothetical protein APUTEX25_000729, partial [Auxenochlorella protothecoides]
PASTMASLPARTFKPCIITQPTPRNETLLSMCPSLSAPYSLPLPLCNGHVETIFAALFRRTPGVVYDRELVHMPDGGLVALDARATPAGEDPLPPTAPVLLLLPGLTGGSEDSYVQHQVHGAAAAGFRPLVMNMRGTSHMPVTTPRFFSAEDTGDIRRIVAHIRNLYPQSMLLAAGWSNGGNILTRYLGEEGDATPITAAAVLCNPFNMVRYPPSTQPMCHENMSSGFSLLYNWNLGKSLRRIYLRHAPLFEAAAAAGEVAYKTDQAASASTISAFDDAITTVTYGYASVDDYYAAASSDRDVGAVCVPTLFVQAEDDPIAVQGAIPREGLLGNPNAILALTPTGGHLGWCGGKDGIFGAPWSNSVVLEWFSAIQKVAPLDFGKDQGGALPEDTTYSIASETIRKVVA